MKTYGKLSVVTLILSGVLFFGSLSFAEEVKQERVKRGERERMTPEQRIDRQVTRMTENLGLTEPQQGQVRSILGKQQKELKALRDDETLERRKKFDKMRSILENTGQEIRALLNEKQQVKYDEQRKEMRQRRRQFRRARQGQDAQAEKVEE